MKRLGNLPKFTQTQSEYSFCHMKPKQNPASLGGLPQCDEAVQPPAWPRMGEPLQNTWQLLNHQLGNGCSLLQPLRKRVKHEIACRPLRLAALWGRISISGLLGFHYSLISCSTPFLIVSLLCYKTKGKTSIFEDLSQSHWQFPRE